MMPSDAEIAAIRSDIEAATLPSTGGAILSVTQVADGQGGFTDTWGTVTSGLVYRLDPVRGQEQLSGGAVMPFFTYVLSLPHGTTITEAHRFKTSSDTYNVRSVDADKSWSGQVRAYVERV